MSVKRATKRSAVERWRAVSKADREYDMKRVVDELKGLVEEAVRIDDPELADDFRQRLRVVKLASAVLREVCQ